MPPKFTYGGQLIIENPFHGINAMTDSNQWGGKLYLTVPVGNESHTFLFEVQTSNDVRREKAGNPNSALHLGVFKQIPYSGSD